MRWLVFHDGAVVATAATAEGAELARRTMVAEYPGMSQGWRGAWPIVGPVDGDPDDPSDLVRMNVETEPRRIEWGESVAGNETVALPFEPVGDRTDEEVYRNDDATGGQLSADDLPPRRPIPPVLDLSMADLSDREFGMTESSPRDRDVARLVDLVLGEDGDHPIGYRGNAAAAREARSIARRLKDARL